MIEPDSAEAKAINWQENLGDSPDGVEVWTKIDDKKGIRNIQTLIRRGRLWWTSNGPDAMYVYYTPTHWALVQT